MLFHEKENTHVTQVTLRVMDLKQSIKFYTNMIGFQIWNQSDGAVYLSAGEERPLLVLEEDKDVKPPNRKATGLYHFALLLPEKADLADLVKHLTRNNIQVASADHLVSEAIYFSDPDGNGIEVYIDRPSSLWEWFGSEVKMAVDPLDIEELFRFETNAGWMGLPDRTVMGHIHLHVSDLEKAKQFYCEGLGFDLVSRLGGEALFISSANYHHHIGLNTWKGADAPPAGDQEAGLKWFDIHFPQDHSRKEAMDRIRRMGAAVDEHEGVIYTLDPSKNRIRLLV
ncbi:VOC family protein [Halobacillus sp. Nhm2S1]|uniref:VOC family protein n=1 Tax=Halobacillus sp. Nhm2S1 TaxID=2866716 RepID=UPI001C72F4F1|nr:VOC family protein [Halobacillus sp. Nhm2S1]MBX0359818.1 VOC family protein [Halobacillus sp. Nhm2S1]